MSKKPTYEELEIRIRELEQAESERSHIEEMLKKSETLFRELFDNMTSGSAIYDVANDGSKGSDYIIRGFNNTSLKIEGKTLDEVIGKSLFDLRPTIDDYGLIPIFQKVWKTGEPAFFPVKIYQDENFSNYYENYVFKIPSGEVVTIYNDVTNEKNAEIELKKSKERFELAMNFANDGLFDWDLKTNQTYYSPGWKKLLGYKDNEIKNEFSEWERLTKPEDVKASLKMINELLEKKRDRFEIEFQMRHKEGYWVDILSRANVIFDEHGQGIRVVGTHVDITERNVAEKKLIKNKKENDSMLNNLLTGFVIHAADTSVIFCNDKATDLLGLTYEQMTGKKVIDPAWNFVHEDLTAMPVEDYPVSKVLSTKKPYYDYVLGIKRPDREYITWIIVNAIPVFSDDNELDKVAVNFIDITERKQAEEAIKRSEALQSKMVANTGDIIVIVDKDGINRYKSPNIEKLFGWKPEEVVGVSTWENIHPEDLESTQKYFGSLMQKPNAVGITECRYKCKDGSYRWIELKGSNLLHDPDIRGILGNYHDITERKKGEQSLRESEARFKSLHNASFGGIAIHDKGIILECNQGLSEITGYSVTELIGMDGLQLFAEKSKNIVMNNIVTGYENSYEAIGIRKNGEEYPVRLEARNIPYKGKRVRTVEFRDITKRKQAEEDREKLQEQLIQAQKMEAIGTLAGGIAHDFNNILSPLLGYAEMLKLDLPADHPFQANVDTMISSALRARDLVQQILTFSRKSEIEIKPIKLQAIVKEAIKLLKSSIPKTIDINPDIDINCGAVNADSTKFHQIIMNLATNAYHSMEESGGELTIALNQIRIEQDSSEGLDILPGTYVRLTVADTGIGMRKDVIDKVFDPYFTTKEKGKGTGLGLSVVHGIVKECNGDIRIHSEPGKGTEIYVYFPVIDRRAAKRAETTGPIIGGTERILLVDDEEAVIRMEERMLERLGYQVTTRTGSIEALEAFKANSEYFDLIVSDMSMPNMTGIQLAQKIKNVRFDIPIIICTGFSEQLTNEKCQALGINDYVMKPVITREFSETIRRVLDAPERSS